MVTVPQPSADKLRVIIGHRNFLPTFVENAAAAGFPQSGMDARSFVRQINQIRDDVRSIVDDPHFDTYVPIAEDAKPDRYTYSRQGTLLNAIATAKTLAAYIDNVSKFWIAESQMSKSIEANLVQAQKQSVDSSTRTETQSVFIAHGHNEIVKLKVQRFISDDLGLKTIVLGDQPGGNRTIAEKLELYGLSASFAVIIFTADDETKDDKFHARQNVV